ncbi:MAG: hypothetical protein WCV55_00520 [Candidatus Paceibacterota bacterium]
MVIKILKFKIKNNNKTEARPKLVCGFTLVETMVAITILLTTIVGPMEIASKALFSSFYARDQITAYYLAQEGVEYLRHERDVYYLQVPTPIDWPADFSNCLVTANNIGCRVDVSNQTITQCGNGASGCGKLNYNSTSGLYSYDTGTASKYSRVVTMSPISSDTILVTSTMSWTGSYLAGGTKSFTIKEVFSNWQTK